MLREAAMGHSQAVRPEGIIGLGGEVHGWRTHLTPAAAALATLAVIVAGAAFADLRVRVSAPVPEEPKIELTELGLRALNELPLAYTAGDLVVVPSGTGPSRRWVGEVPVERIVGPAIPIGTRGLSSYGIDGTSAEAPEWVRELTPRDRVYADVGALFFACTAVPGEDLCRPSLLSHHDTTYYAYGPGLGPPRIEVGEPMQVFTFDTFDGTERQQLLVGRLAGTDAEQVLVRMQDGSHVSAWATSGLGVPGETVWWATVSRPVASVAVHDAAGDVLAEVELSR
ncbi:MAG TPA: hypothetical protein VFG63_03545 [Nocardioidaceae bacterium]|nr:hypothetical protein [Nocardioidaceae bacterium]